MLTNVSVSSELYFSPSFRTGDGDGVAPRVVVPGLPSRFHLLLPSPGHCARGVTLHTELDLPGLELEQRVPDLDVPADN